MLIQPIIDQAILKLLQISKVICNNPLRVNRHKIKEHISLLTESEKITNFSLEKVYMKKIKLL
jgi:hypothetical protein